MSKKKASKSNSARVPGYGQLAVVDPTATKFTGPIRSRGAASGTSLFEIQLCNSGLLQSSAGGVIATVFDPAAQAGVTPNWTNLANIYEEYRILGVEYDFYPVNVFNKPTTTNVFPLLCVIDRNTATPLASDSDALGFDSCQIKPMEKPWKRSIRMDGVEESLWVGTGTLPSANALFYLKLYVNGLTASTTYMKFFTTILVQFRGTK